MAIEKKNQNPGAVLELPAKQHCQFSPFCPIFEVNGLDWAGWKRSLVRSLVRDSTDYKDQAIVAVNENSLTMAFLRTVIRKDAHVQHRSFWL